MKWTGHFYYTFGCRSSKANSLQGQWDLDFDIVNGPHVANNDISETC